MRCWKNGRSAWADFDEGDAVLVRDPGARLLHRTVGRAGAQHDHVASFERQPRDGAEEQRRDPNRATQQLD